MGLHHVEELNNRYIAWFSQYEWRWFITQKITNGRPSKTRAIALSDQWLDELGKTEGSPHFRWVRVLERGKNGDHLHFHLLVGGFRNRMAHWGRRWEELGGDVLIENYNSEEGGIAYLLKGMKRNGDIDIDFKLPKRKAEK